jgi:hypothetical protein
MQASSAALVLMRAAMEASFISLRQAGRGVLLF